MRRESRYPFTPYPDGWYCVAASSELAAGEVRPIRYLGRDLVLFRTESGRAAVLDAHCPHLGAHLGHGGRVVGESIRCPFHAWRFAAEGACVDIPYQTRGVMPLGASMRPHRVDERAGLILLWHSDADRQPGWRMRDIPEYEADDWLGYETRRWTIRMHVQELAENVPDRAHFHYVHQLPEVPRTEAWTEGPVYHQETILGGDAGSDWLVARQEIWGLGLIWLRSAGDPPMFFLTATTPIDDEYCEVSQYVLVHDGAGRGEIGSETRQALEALFAQTEADVPIWENKVYREKPPLVADDGPLAELRSWARQFYPAPQGDAG